MNTWIGLIVTCDLTLDAVVGLDDPSRSAPFSTIEPEKPRRS